MFFSPLWRSSFRGTPAALRTGGSAALGGPAPGIPDRAHDDRGPLVRHAPGPHRVPRGSRVSAVLPGPHRGSVKGLRRPLQPFLSYCPCRGGRSQYNKGGGGPQTWKQTRSIVGHQ